MKNFNAKNKEAHILKENSNPNFVPPASNGHQPKTKITTSPSNCGLSIDPPVSKITTTNKIYITIEGGMISQVFANAKMDVTVVDFDVQEFKQERKNKNLEDELQKYIQDGTLIQIY